MNTTNSSIDTSENTSETTFQANPFGVAIGAGLAITASFGILTAYIASYYGGEGKRPVYWLSIGIFFIISTLISYIIARSRK